jgi:hypothetical protein
MARCRRFENDPALLGRPYDVVSRVGVDSFRTFANAIGGAGVNITNQNVFDLYLLCREFIFGELQGPVDAYLHQHEAIDVDSRREIQALKVKDDEQQGRIDALEREVAALRQELQATKTAHDTDLRRLAGQTTSLIRAQLVTSAPGQSFQIIIQVGGADRAVTVSGEREFSNQANQGNDNRRFQLAEPIWNQRNQLFRFGDGADSDMILPVCHPGYVWDQPCAGGAFYLHPRHGERNQRFQYKPADGRLICRASGEAVTYVGRVPPMVGAPADAARADAQRFEIRFQVADVASRLKFLA